MASQISNSYTPAVCVITARLKQSRQKGIKALSTFDKTDYTGLERELISCLKQHYSLTHFTDTDASDWSLPMSPSFPARMNPRGYAPIIASSQSAGFLSDTFSFGKDLRLLQQFMADNPHVERFVINLFAKDASQIKSDYLAGFLRLLAPSKGVVFYFCRKATRKAFQKEFGSSLCGLLQFSVQKYILETRDKRTLLDSQKMLTHLNSYLKALMTPIPVIREHSVGNNCSYN